MLPFLAGLAAAWIWRGEALGNTAQALTVLWGCAILPSLSGVRRGVSFRMEGGVTLIQIATMIGLFSLGFAAPILAGLARNGAVPVPLIVGLLAITILDPIAARLFFARLRPAQIPLAILGLAALLALQL